MATEIKISGIGKSSCVNLRGIDGSVQTFTDKTKSIKVDDITLYTQGIEALKGMGLKVETKAVAERVRGGSGGEGKDASKDNEGKDVSKDNEGKTPEADADA